MSPKRGMLIVVALLLFGVSFAVFGAGEGCYYYSGASSDFYCQPGVSDANAEQDCTRTNCGDFRQFFTYGSSCAEISDCQQVQCKSDCVLKPLGKCRTGVQAVLGSNEAAEVPAGGESLWCDPGCCKITAGNFCNYGLTKFQCQQRAQQLGVAGEQFNNDPSMTTDSCLQTFCGLTNIKGTVVFTMKDEEGRTLSGVGIELEGSVVGALESPSGTYRFADVISHTYRVIFTKGEYTTKILAVTVAAGEIKTIEVTLTKSTPGQATLQGRVTVEGAGLSGVTISVTKGTASPLTVATNADGRYTFSLSPDSYTVTASKSGYGPQKQENILFGANGVKTLNFELSPELQQGIKGQVTYQGPGVAGARIYIDGVFKGFSKPAPTLGEFNLIPISDAAVPHTILVTYQRLQQQQQFSITSGETKYLAIQLDTVAEICSPGNEKPVEQLLATAVPGKREVRLEWVKPCPEVTGFSITRKEGENPPKTIPASIADIPLLDADGLEWGKTYEYSIVPTYVSGISTLAPATAAIRLGDPLCEGKYHSEIQQMESFCRIGRDGEQNSRTKVWTCDENNEITLVTNCLLDGPRYFCAREGELRAGCKEDTACALAGTPFGLYFSRGQCYGSYGSATGVENFCVYDYGTSINQKATTLNQCQSCTKIDSCFEYRSKDACTTNNCLTEQCAWVEGASNVALVDYTAILQQNTLPQLVTPETGAGYCVEKDFNEKDFTGEHCNSCGPGADIFENYFCTAEVCKSLGRCYSSIFPGQSSSDDFSSCQFCGDNPDSDHNCYSYKTHLECSGSNMESGVRKNDREELIFSKDTCGWKRCAWGGPDQSYAPGGCFKDGNADSIDDCSNFGETGQAQRCRADNEPPKTTLQPEGFTPIISQVAPNVTFNGIDLQSRMGLVKYCLTSARLDSPDKCTTNNYQPAAYQGLLLDEVLQVDLLHYLQEQKNGEPFRLKFFSLDEYFNQEEVQEAAVFIDNVPPDFEITETHTTVGDTTQLKIALAGETEPISCDFVLQQILPLGDNRTAHKERSEVKEVEFTELQGVRFDLHVGCQDDRGNTQTKIKQFRFDLEEGIEVVSPEGVVASTSLIFNVNTKVEAVCMLYSTSTGERLVEFTPAENGKSHITGDFPGFVEKNYVAEHKVACQELVTGDIMEDYFNFQVDFTPPSTNIFLKEGVREEKPRGYGWEYFFVRSATVSFTCTSDGFECEKTFYCLGEGCELLTNANYKQFSVPVEVASSSKICYYSTDKGRSPVYSPECGMIKVEGYGITLEKPLLHLYREQPWGISSAPAFDWQFYTKVPTKECRFDFESGFEYEDVPLFRRLTPNSEKKYLFEQFPGEIISPYPKDGGVKVVYVQCSGLEGEIGPEQELHLEYDPTSPEIVRAEAEPDTVYEGITTTLLVDTDDKTLCRYDDGGSYETMRYGFPGMEERILEVEHQGQYYIPDVGPEGRKEFRLQTQCANGAELLSTPAEITFLVDYVEQGFIISLKPEGFLTTPDVTLEVETSKRARCKYRLDGVELSPFDTADGKRHTKALVGLADDHYQYLVNCEMIDSGFIARSEISFTVDSTVPVIRSVDDGTLSCGSNETQVMVYTNEENISSYHYELYDQGKFNRSGLNASAASSALLVRNATVDSTLPLIISTSGLIEGNNYSVKVQAVDLGGHISLPIQSNGYAIVLANYSACANDTRAPQILILRNESCTATQLELHCDDGSGCKNFKYGQGLSSANCDSTLAYNGQKIAFDRNGWLCYTVADMRGNNLSDAKQVLFSDEDGDGSADKCDQCPQTKDGKPVDNVGCAEGDVPSNETILDTDKDGLPDFWEKTYYGDDCVLHYASADSNGNGLSDNLEDYDGDLALNYEEYRGSTDPCDASDTPLKKETPAPKGNVTKVKEEEDKVKDTESNILAWVLLIIGLLLVAGGSGYLTYYYHQPPATKISEPMPLPFHRPPMPQEGVLDTWKKKLLLLRRSREEREQERARREAFASFGKQSPAIPHVQEALQAKGDHLTRVQQLAEKYVSAKKEIAPGLKVQEKGIFSKLESIAKQTKTKDISEVTTPQDAKKILEQLRKVSEQRKKK